MPIKHSPFVGERAYRIVGSPRKLSSINYNRSMSEDLKLSHIGSSPLPPPFRGTLLSRSTKTLSNYLRLLFPEIVYYAIGLIKLFE